MTLADQMVELLNEARQDGRTPLAWRMRREAFQRLQAEQDQDGPPGPLEEGAKTQFGGVPIQFGITSRAIGAELILAD